MTGQEGERKDKIITTSIFFYEQGGTIRKDIYPIRGFSIHFVFANPVNQIWESNSAPQPSHPTLAGLDIEYRSDTSSGENMPSLITTKIGKRNNRDVKPENLVPLTEAQLHDLLVFARSNLPKRNSYGFDGSDRISVVSYLQALISNQQQAGVFSAK